MCVQNSVCLNFSTVTMMKRFARKLRYHEYGKQKSLGLLCVRFLHLFHLLSGKRECDVPLDVAAKCLGVERRRIYDCVNVLECLTVVSRKAKNVYTWHGVSGIASALRRIANIDKNRGAETLQPSGQSSQAQMPSPPPKQVSIAPQSGKEPRKSLAELTQSFMELFFTGHGSFDTPRQLTIDMAAEALQRTHETPSQLKTKARRLYDIANICVCLEIVSKVTVNGHRKPWYKWEGFKRYPTTARAVRLPRMILIKTQSCIPTLTSKRPKPSSSSGGAEQPPTSVVEGPLPMAGEPAPIVKRPRLQDL